jgi:hypothetical protein
MSFELPPTFLGDPWEGRGKLKTENSKLKTQTRPSTAGDHVISVGG